MVLAGVTITDHMDRWHNSGRLSESVESPHGPTDRWQTWTDPAGDRVGLSEQLGLLTDVDRQHAIQCLASGPEVMEFEALVDCAVACHRGVDAGRVRLRLHHIHLPRLSDLGVVQYEPDAGLIHTMPERVDAILELRDVAVA